MPSIVRGATMSCQSAHRARGPILERPVVGAALARGSRGRRTLVDQRAFVSGMNGEVIERHTGRHEREEHSGALDQLARIEGEVADRDRRRVLVERLYA